MSCDCKTCRNCEHWQPYESGRYGCNSPTPANLSHESSREEWHCDTWEAKRWKPKPVKEECLSCRYFLLSTIPPGGVTSLCRRYPTDVKKHAADWCGKWEVCPELEETK